MYSKHRKYSKSSNKFNKETKILIISCIIESVYPINANIAFSHVLYMCTILTPLTYTYTFASHKNQILMKMLWDGTYGFSSLIYPWGLESLTVCRCHNKGSTFFLSYFKTLNVSPAGVWTGSDLLLTRTALSGTTELTRRSQPRHSICEKYAEYV